MSKQPTSWIDMTDLSSWNGHFTGIQRVVYNIAKGYHDKGETGFFTFDPRKERFYSFDFASFREAVESRTSDSINPEPIIGKKQQLVKRAKQVYTYAPSTVKRVIPAKQLKKVARKGYNQYKKVGKLKSYLSGQNIGHSAVNFSKGDTVLILGNSWDRPNFLLAIKDVKQQKDIKVYQVVYDLIPSFQPQAFNEELYKKYTRNMFEVATISDGLMAISKSTKRDMERFCEELKIHTPPITVIRLGDDIPASKKPKPPRGMNIGDSFILCVGTIEARKNHMLLYYAWKEGISKGIEMPKLIIVGRPGWYTNDLIHTLKTDPEMVNRVKILNNVSDDELVWLYNNCAFTVYPSYYEGWGLPVAESLAMGKACLTSSVSSMPEVGGDLCLYHSPYNSAECLQGIIDLMDDKTRSKLEEKIKANYKLVQWSSTYEQCHNFVTSF